MWHSETETYSVCVSPWLKLSVGPHCADIPPRRHRRQIDERTYERCSVPDEREFLDACGLSPAQVSFPIPVMPLSALPDIERVINASQAVLADLQAQYHRVIILG